MAQRLTQSSPKASPKTHADATRLTRKDGVYYYRRRLPGPDRTDVAVSLGTRNFREAEHLAEGLDLLYSRTVKTVTDPSELRTILRNFLREELEDDASSRPIDVVVLNCWVIDTNEAPCRSSVSTMRAKSARDRVSRSIL